MNAQSNNVLDVNGGIVQPSERPLWVGLSEVVDNVNGRYMLMSVSLDRDWIWVRFANTPSEKSRKSLVGNGFIFSSKRKGWHVEVSEHITNYLSDLGAQVSFHQVASYIPPKQPEKITGNLDLDKPADKAVADALANLERAKQKLAEAERKSAERAAKEKAKLEAEAKRKVETAKPEDTASLLMVKLMEELIHLRREVNELRSNAQAPQQVPNPVTNYSNGYHVGGIKLG